jgi:MraZ protein
MLLGEHEHSIDDKNRITLPAKFRAVFAAGVVLTRGMDGCLYAYRSEDWTHLVESRLAELDPLSKEGRRMQRFMFSGATEAELDGEGAADAPEPARAGNERDLMVPGHGPGTRKTSFALSATTHTPSEDRRLDGLAPT